MMRRVLWGRCPLLLRVMVCLALLDVLVMSGVLTVRVTACGRTWSTSRPGSGAAPAPLLLAQARLPAAAPICGPHP